MKNAPPTTRDTPLLVAYLLSAAGCENQAGNESPTSITAPVRLSGQVFSDAGSVTQGKVEAQDAKGNIAAHTELNGQSAYVLLIPAGTRCPLTLTTRPAAALEIRQRYRRHHGKLYG